MNFTMIYWYWLVLGMVLIIAEMLFVGSFTIIWFGLGALIVGAALWFFPGISLSWQLFLWAVSSIFLTVLWFRFFKPLMPDRTKAGIPREAILGEVGQVIKVPVEKKEGIVRFTTPLLGSDEWPFVCEEKVSTGDRVFVRDISGNTLIVGRRDPNPHLPADRANGGDHA